MTLAEEKTTSTPLAGDPQYVAMPARIQEWIGASPAATEAFSNFFQNQGKIQAIPGVGLPYYNPSNPPTIVVDQAQWDQLREPGAPEYPQRHLFGTLAHEIGHDRYNTGNVLFKGGSADDYVHYRAGLEAQAIFTAFPIFKDLEREPAFKQDFPFNSIGYLNGIELATLYKQWRSGEQSDQAIVERIAAKVPDTRYSLGNPPPDLNHDGAVTHRDAYLRDYQQLIRQRPELAHPPAPDAHKPATATPRLSDADRSMLEQIEASALKSLQAAGQPHDPQTVERIGHALLAACKDGRDCHPGAQGYSYAANALGRVDHVVLSNDGRNLFAVQGRLDDPAQKRALVHIVQAAQTPVEHSDQKLDAANKLIASERSQTRQDAPTHHAEQASPVAIAR
ncbi:XVIPCD domain-containing protein [Lysobacter enzymogenes]|uniref:XVIPCD domain-containing protein n=1 Tax=Lysobacter enzymogenes TaxID=69 RepID=UPI00384F4605